MLRAVMKVLDFFLIPLELVVQQDVNVFVRTVLSYDLQENRFLIERNSKSEQLLMRFRDVFISSPRVFA